MKCYESCDFRRTKTSCSTKKLFFMHAILHACYSSWDWNPVYKSDDRHARENYRPTTGLSCVNKVFERLLGNQVTPKFDCHLGDCQTAYRRHYSCESTLLGLVEDWKQAKDNQLSVCILSTDMSKAFDCLHPPLMLSKLKAYGFHDRAIDVLRSYLCDRQCRVRMGAATSSWKLVNRSCPHGVSLGTALEHLSKRSYIQCRLRPNYVCRSPSELRDR